MKSLNFKSLNNQIMKKRNFIAMMILTTVATGCGEKAVETQEPKKEVVPAIELGNMDTSINPADDFFRYCNNNWMKNNPIPEEYSTFGAFTEIDQHNEILIQEIIDEVSKDAKTPMPPKAAWHRKSATSTTLVWTPWPSTSAVTAS